MKTNLLNMNTMNSYITKTSLTKKKQGGGFKERERERELKP